MTLTAPTTQPWLKRLPTLLYWGFFVLGLGWMLYIWSQSTGTPADDELTHVLVARSDWHYPFLILDIWMRVANSLIFMVPSLLGLNGVRLSAVIMTVLTLLLTTLIGRRMGIKWLFLIPLLFWFQPWVSDLGYTGIKSIPFMFLLTLGIYMWLSDHPLWAAFLVGTLPLSRHEGIALTGVWFLYMLYRRKWGAAILCWLPVALYNVVYWLQYQASFQDLPIAIYFRPQSSGYYGSGPWYHFFPPVVVGVGIPVLLWSVFGLPSLRHLRGKAIWMVLPVTYFVVHTVIYLFGLYESGGYGMFLIPIAPGFALLASLGVENLIRWLPAVPALKKAVPVATAIALMLAVIPPIYTTTLTTTPRLMNEAEHTAQEAVNWMKSYGAPDEIIYATYPWFNLLYGLILTPDKKYITNQIMEDKPIGTIFLWDLKYSDVNGVTREFLAQRGWKEITRFNGETIIVYKREALTGS